MWTQIYSPWRQDEEWSRETNIMHIDFYAMKKLQIKGKLSLHDIHLQSSYKFNLLTWYNLK